MWAHIKKADLSRIDAMADDVDEPVFIHILVQFPLVFADFQKIPTAAIDKIVYGLDVLDDFLYFEVMSFVFHICCVSHFPRYVELFSDFELGRGLRNCGEVIPSTRRSI